MFQKNVLRDYELALFVSYVIETVELSKTYSGGVQALKGLNMKIKAGESVGFLGPNGAGKTTTIQILLNLIHPTSGEVYLFEEPMKGRARELLSRVGALVGEPGYYNNLTPNDLLEYICQSYRMDKRTTTLRIKEVLEEVRLSDVRFKKIGTFSTGMKRRLGIAQVLVHDPELIILDEPTLGLDPKGIREIRDIIKGINKEGKTIFLTSHNLTEAYEINQRFIFLDKGKLISDESIEKIESILGESIIEVEFYKDVSPDKIDLVRRISGVVDVKKDTNHSFILEYSGDKKTVHAILKEIVNLNLPIITFNPRHMTLEDYYLRLYSQNEGN